MRAWAQLASVEASLGPSETLVLGRSWCTLNQQEFVGRHFYEEYIDWYLEEERWEIQCLSPGSTECSDNLNFIDSSNRNTGEIMCSLSHLRGAKP